MSFEQLWAKLLGIGLLLSLGCAGSHDLPTNFAAGYDVVEESAPLGGAALLARRQQMARAHRDLIHFHTTLESLSYRNDRRGLKHLTRFVDAYMGMHLAPLLRSAWQSRHPEVAALDANLRFAQADVLIRMRQTGRAQRVIDEIARRFEGRDDMLIDYPVGRQSTLARGLEILREGKWQG